MKPKKMTISAARKKLRLGAGDHLSSMLAYWKTEEARLESDIADAPTSEVKAILERELAELRQALVVAAKKPKRTSRVNVILRWASLWILVVAGGVIGYLELSKRGIVGGSANEVVVEKSEAEIKIEEALEKRRWDEAESMLAVLGSENSSESFIEKSRASIAKGRLEEKAQQQAFLVNNVKGALEGEQFEEAGKFLAELQADQPDHPQIAEFKVAISEGREKLRLQNLELTLENTLAKDELEEAEVALSSLVETDPNHPKISHYRESLAKAKVDRAERREKAAVVVAKFYELDQGTYSPELLALAEEAVRLDPSPENRRLYQRASAYGKVLKVPGDFATIKEALSVAAANDRILVANGTYDESLILPLDVEIRGESREKTIIECLASESSVITVTKASGAAKVSNLTLRHRNYLDGDERYPILSVDAGQVEVLEVNVTRGAGHGIAVLNGGRASIINSKTTYCSWDGIAVLGENSWAHLNKVTSSYNLHHGVDYWEGGGGSVHGSSFEGNGRAGLLAIKPADLIFVEDTKCIKNREVGFHFADAVGVTMASCESHENLLGGVAFFGESTGIKLTENNITKNGKTGLVLEKGSELEMSRGNKASENEGKQFWQDAVFEKPETADLPPAPDLNE